jgi:hypothetical protein
VSNAHAEVSDAGVRADPKTTAALDASPTRAVTEDGYGAPTA